MQQVNPPDGIAPNQNAIVFEAERFILRLENAPAVVTAASDAAVKVGVVMAGGYLVYKLANTPAFLGALTRVVEGLGEAFIEKVRAGSLEITLIAENQQTAETIRQFYKDGILLKQFNIALRKYGTANNDPQLAFITISLIQPTRVEVNPLDLPSLRSNAEEEFEEASVHGIKYEKNPSNARNYVEIQTTKETISKTTRQKTEVRYYKDEGNTPSTSACELPTIPRREPLAASSSDTVKSSSCESLLTLSHETNATLSCEIPTMPSRDSATHEVSQASNTTPKQTESGKLGIKDIESIFGVVDILSTGNLHKVEHVVGNRVLDEAKFTMMGYVQFHKQCLTKQHFSQIGLIRNKMFNLMETNFNVSGNDLKSLAEKIHKTGNFFEAILFYEISAMFYLLDNSVETITAIRNCLRGIYKSLMSLKVSHKALFKPIAREYVIPAILDLRQSVQNRKREEVVVYCQCLRYIGHCYVLAKDYDSSLSTYSEACSLLQKTRVKDDAEAAKVYHVLLKNIEVTKDKMSKLFRIHY